jgi:hypothetical protein
VVSCRERVRPIVDNSGPRFGIKKMSFVAALRIVVYQDLLIKEIEAVTKRRCDDPTISGIGSGALRSFGPSGGSFNRPVHRGSLYAARTPPG